MTKLTSAAMETISRSITSINTSFVLCSYETNTHTQNCTAFESFLLHLCVFCTCKKCSKQNFLKTRFRKIIKKTLVNVDKMLLFYINRCGLLQKYVVQTIQITHDVTSINQTQRKTIQCSISNKCIYGEFLFKIR